MKTPILHRARAIAHRASPLHTVKRINTAKLMRRFANDLGLVYFGYVSQQDDEYRLVRGITASNSHQDHHFIVGTFDNYNVAFLVRRDTLVYADRRLKDHSWTITTIDLHTSKEIPHFMLGNHVSREFILAKYLPLTPYVLPTDGRIKQFTDSYTLYASLEHGLTVGQYLTADLLEAFAHHATGMSVEVYDGTIYVYAREKHPSRALLEKMLRLGLWLAENLDQRAGQVD